MIMLIMLRSVTVSNCTGEQIFSKMVIIKINLRSTMGQTVTRLNMLSLISIKREILRASHFDYMKARTNASLQV